ncbi:galactokinase [Larkinella rosea]|uniref:Galactokinase n=1 Tax=Larkinella rosea TaxID=2025312 RepID=A0A3P1BRS2_9BACT|nr:galactokinase [Larkinella rosea]RRB03748.1 galactokinase [Larkinella rosea]
MIAQQAYVHQVEAVFWKEFNRQPELLVRGPGRINLLGEHTDYNGGLVLPASIDKEIIFALGKRSDQTGRIVAENLNRSFSFSLDQITPSPQGWPNYLMGVVDQMQKAGYFPGGFDLVFGGNIPSGAGLSSSAALECGLAFGLNKLYNLGLATIDMVKLSQRAENQFVGVNCGIMDQFASMFGRDQAVIQLDCKSLHHEYFPFQATDYVLILCDTGVKHSLNDSEYNTRRQECETGVSILQQYNPDIRLLRDATTALVEAHRDEMPGKVYQRCHYVTEEIQRVREACEYLLENDLAAFGKKMYETHNGLQHDYEVSCPELDFLVDQTRMDDAVLGARMMGGGFGGCTINIVESSAADAFVARMSAVYEEKFNIELKCYPVRITDGTSEISS